LSFEWFEAPSEDRVQAALSLLERLGAIDGQAHLSALGRQLQRIPLHPRLARILLDGRGAPEVAMVCAQLGAGGARGAGGAGGATEIAEQLRRIASVALGGNAAAHISDEELRHAIFTGYADRLAKRRSHARDRFVLATGHGAVLARESDVGEAEYLVALDLVAAERDRISEARIRAASAVDAAWIQATSVEVEHRFDSGSGRVRAARVERYDAIVLNETPVPVEPEVAARMLGDAWLARGHDEATTRLIRRLRFAGSEVDLAALARAAAAAARTIDEIDIESHLPFDVKRALAERAPATIVVPSGRSMRLEYGDDGSVSASVKLQELFGLAASPVIGPARVPVTFHLLAPSGRPVQTTRDLRSFWERTYPEVRKELRGRYPKHPWPDDPWTAQPTHRTTRRR
jgi:ATP-dependent helicase HrpB